jgi:SAM-dependent methyltransferase
MKRDYSQEISFWKNHIEQKDRFKSRLINLLNKEKRKKEFPRIILKISKQIKTKPLETLEIGSGPTSGLAWGVDRGLVNVFAIDPLAEEYKKILKKNKINYPIIPRKIEGEKINKYFKKNSFEITYSRNSLDHVKNPKKVFKNMINLTKSGGYIILEFRKNEGTHAKWTGLHNHNLDLEDKNISLLTNGKRKKFLKSNKLKFEESFSEGNKIGDWKMIVFRKK